MLRAPRARQRQPGQSTIGQADVPPEERAITDFRAPIVLLLSATLVSVGLSARRQAGQAAPGVRDVSPTYESARGPVIAFDEAHRNPTYARVPALITLLQDDGYRPRQLTQSISAASLADISILVTNDPQTSLSDDEVSAVVGWLKGGGSLLLVLDHYASTQSRLTASLGVRNWPGNSADVRTDLCKQAAPGCTGPDPAGNRSAMNILFWRSEFFPGGEPKLAVLGSGGGQGYQSADAVLGQHAITDGRGPGERIRRVATFSGSAFEALPGGVALLTLPRGATVGAATTLPNTVLGVAELQGTPITGWLQGAVTEVGKGRLAIFADSAVVSGGVAADKDQFTDNRQFVLNVMHWLSRVL